MRSGSDKQLGDGKVAVEDRPLVGAATFAAWVCAATVGVNAASAGGGSAFGRLVEQMMTTEPYVSAKRVFWIVDNGSSHRGQASIQRLETAWPTLCLIHLPVHASWLDQCEIYFSIEQRKVVKPNDFTILDQISERIEAFEARYNQRAVPFDWKFGREDLDKLCHRLDTHQTAA